MIPPRLLSTGKCYFPQRKSGHCFQNTGRWTLESEKQHVSHSDGTSIQKLFSSLSSLRDNRLVFIYTQNLFPSSFLWLVLVFQLGATHSRLFFLNRNINISGSLNSSSHDTGWVPSLLWLFSLKPASACLFSHSQHGDQRKPRYHFWQAFFKAECSRRPQNHKTFKTKWSFISTSVWGRL